ncbi:unnamed protein product [Symbiodinium natans]|uniref:Uncharacterized protein n=1 Tax=Symbiodinium natans TaxID=878477 RepID=A0A812IIP9_9DINO|nr:unnamed protein product [Symbiodinium natans]
MTDWVDMCESVETSPQMMVFVMLLLMCLLCAMVEGIGRFLAHAMSFFLDSRSQGSETSVNPDLHPGAADKDLAMLAPVRLVGAIHLVFNNYGPVSWAGFNAWGASWFSLFFLLSGLGSAHVKLQRNTQPALHPGRQIP